ncbi:MAG TPA: hypothetical protein ENI33_02185 [Thermoplasmatales archaeon]|nr:hypothetical protein [Thermoplasmatales archaeon]
MNRKKIFTVFVAIGVAGMLIALPYETNAIGVLGGIIIGTLIGTTAMLIYDWLNKENAQDNVEYSYSASEYKAAWQDKIEYIKNSIALWRNHTLNLVNVTENTNLYWVRYAERKSLEYLDKENWSEVEPHVLEEFKNFIEDLYNTSKSELLLIFKELSYELNAMQNLSLSGSDYVGLYGYEASTLVDKYFSTEDFMDDNHRIFLILDDKGTSGYTFEMLENFYLLNISYIENNSYTCFYDDYIVCLEENTTDIEDMLQFNLKFMLKDFYNGEYIVFPLWHFGQTENDYSYVYSSSGKTNKDIDTKIEIDLDGTTYFYFEIIVPNVFDDIVDVYNTIKNNMVINAQTTFETYSELYDNISEMPEDEIPIFPDVVLDNIEALGNLTVDNALPLFYMILNQLSNSTLLNYTEITDMNLTVPNYVGKIFNITVKKWTDEINYTILVNSSLCYILPQEKDLTLEKGRTYILSSSETLEFTPSGGYDKRIEQKIWIFNLQTHEVIEIPHSIYTVEVHNITIDGDEVNSVTLDITDIATLTQTEWGFRFTITDTVPEPTVTEQSWLDWLEEHKGLVVVVCTVLGILLMASSKKGSGGHTIGILLLIAGIGMAFYFYILPAIEGIGSFWDKLTFWD